MVGNPQLPECVLNRLIRLTGVPASQIRWECLRSGKWCNANVYRIDLDEDQVVVKEFYSRSAFVRETIGRLLIWREFSVMKRLNGMPGVPGGIRRLGRCALMMDYISGKTFSTLTVEHKDVPRRVFEDLERHIETIHAAGYVHLDLRNMGNVVVDEDGNPYIIDFQSYCTTRCLPGRLRLYAQEADYSGVYKGWQRLCNDRLDEKRFALMKRVERRRRFWVLEGYWLDKFFSRVNIK